MARYVLGLVGVAYLVLAGWCAVHPSQTSKFVGFNLQPGSGQSEFLTVYGGLQLALGLLFLWPMYRPADVGFSSTACLLVHACLVAFRSVSFLLYTGIPATTYSLAATEWVILIAAAILCWKKG